MSKYTWAEYYENIWDWPTSKAVKHIADISSFGSPDEITEVINEIAFYDEKGAICLLKKATDSGIKFTGEQFTDMGIDDNEEELKRSIRFSCDKFTDEDLEALEGFFEDDFVIAIARQAKVKIPKAILEVYEECLDEELDHDDSSITHEEFIEMCDQVLGCLYDAHEALKKALLFCMGDIRQRKPAVDIMKHYCLQEAQIHVNEAQKMLGEIESYTKHAIRVQDIRLNMGKNIVFHDAFGDGFLVNSMVQRRIKKMLKNVEELYKEVIELKRQ